MKSFAVICVLLHIRQGQADAVCSESPGSCATRRSSLMQVRSLQQKTSAATTMKSKLAGFQQFTEKMIAKFGQDPHDGSGVNSSSEDFKNTLKSVALVLKFIHQMGDTLLSYHEDDMKKVKSCQSIYTDCISTHVNETWIESMNASKINWKQKENAHAECRDNRSVTATVDHANCVRYDDYRQNASDDSPALLDSCVGNDEEKDFQPSYIQDTMNPGRQNDEFEDSNLHKMEQCLEKTAEWLHGSDKILDGSELGLYDLYTKCTRTGGSCKDEADSCRTRQHEFEESHCEWNVNKNLKCGTIHACVNSEDSFCDGMCDGVEADAAARAADNETGRRLICLLEVLFGKQSADDPDTFEARLEVDERQVALNTCKDGDYDTSFWDISCPTGWKPNHPNMGSFPFSCACESLSDSASFNQQNYYHTPPGFGSGCTAAQEEDETTFEQCCLDKNISLPGYTCPGGTWEHCNVFSAQN